MDEKLLKYYRIVLSDSIRFKMFQTKTRLLKGEQSSDFCEMPVNLILPVIRLHPWVIYNFMLHDAKNDFMILGFFSVIQRPPPPQPHNHLSFLKFFVKILE